MPNVKIFFLFLLGFFSLVTLIVIYHSKFKLEENKIITLSGQKLLIVNKIKSLAEECLNKNKNSKNDKICFEINVNSDEEIKASDLEGLAEEDLGKNFKAYIIYSAENRVKIKKIEELIE